MLHHVKDLSAEKRRAVELLLGRSLEDGEAVSIKAINPASIVDAGLSDDARHKALSELDAYFTKVDAQRTPMSAEQEEALINEALRCARPSYRPVH